MNKRVIYFILAAVLLLLLVGCETPGTSTDPDKGNNEKYTFEKYYYDTGNNDYVIIATRKDSLPVMNISEPKSSGKSTIIQSYVIDENERPIKYVSDTVYQYRKEDILLKNDSIIVIRK